MYKQASHRILKNRALKRRVTSHHYSPKRMHTDNNEFALLRVNQTALNKLKHKPELLVKVFKSLDVKQTDEPKNPHLQLWRELLDNLADGQCTIESVTEQVMGYDNKAKMLRETKVLECLLD